jgi:hypothetical protein
VINLKDRDSFLDRVLTNISLRRVSKEIKEATKRLRRIHKDLCNVVEAFRYTYGTHGSVSMLLDYGQLIFTFSEFRENSEDWINPLINILTRMTECEVIMEGPVLNNGAWSIVIISPEYLKRSIGPDSDVIM